jgi:hypothetical protein
MDVVVRLVWNQNFRVQAARAQGRQYPSSFLPYMEWSQYTIPSATGNYPLRVARISASFGPT